VESDVIAVTGASGHLGQWVVAELTRLGHDVLCVARKPLDRPNIAGVRWSRPVRTLSCDLSGTADLAAGREELLEADSVVHLAAHIPGDTARNSPEDAHATLRCNVIGTIRLLALLSGGSRLSSFAYASTFEVYGAPETLPVGEEHPTRPLGYYGASKLAGEKYVELFSAAQGVPACSLRLPAIYGPGDRLARAIGNFIRAGAGGGQIQIHGDGLDRRELVYVADAADAVGRAVRRRARGAINVASGVGYGIREMADAVIRAADGQATPVQRERVKPRLDYVLAVDRAREVLGWEPRTSLDDGVRAQLQWVRSDGRS
jgi:UDP-glucose 4-epimerase